MSFDSMLIACTGCDFQARDFFQPVTLVYRLPDGTEAPAYRERGWCHACAHYRDIERIDIPKLENVLAEEQVRFDVLVSELRAMLNLWWRWFVFRSRKRAIVGDVSASQAKILALARLIAALHSRSSGPRCLECGSEKTESLDFENGVTQRFRHTCGGRLRIVPSEEDEDPIRVNFGRGSVWFLNTEGEIVASVREGDLRVG
jgi:hypothetical protein